MNKHYAFPKIRQYHQVLRDLKLHSQYVGKDDNGDPIFDNTKELPTLLFKGTVKLHGTNSAVVFSPDGTFYCQSRENIIDEIKDNAGFAHWVNKEGKGVWESVKHFFNREEIKHVVLFGEWCGGSIQKGVALNELSKRFVIFGVKVIFDDDSSYWLEESLIPEMPEINVYNIARIATYDIEVDLARPDKAIEKMVEIATKIGDECPFAKSFGVSGTGEGAVFRLKGEYGFGNAYKVKDEKHTRSKIKKLPTVDVVKMDNLQQAVETHIHEDRLQQIYDKIVLSEADKVPQNIGEFVRQTIEDAWTEEGDSIRASDISRKEFGAATSKVAARWFQNKLKEI
jgi:RNA ligase